MIFAQFHFLRPEWLLALIPVVLLIAHLRRAKSVGNGSEWANHVDAHLLRHLTAQDTQTGGGRWVIMALATALFTTVVALAGPSWQKQPVPAFEPQTPSVIVLSLAQSMNSADLVPSRLVRAGHKLRDMLDRAQGDDTALVIYADQPFVAAPLTSDSAVIRQMLPELSTSLMPVLGNRLDLAIAQAQGLLVGAGATRGRIVVLADDTGMNPEAAQKAAAAAQKAGFTVNVLGVGTADGATLQTAQGRAIQTEDGQRVIVKVDEQGLGALAAAGGGSFSLITAGDSDLDKVFADQSDELRPQGGMSDRTGDSWLDMGYFLLFIPLLLAPLAFRRGLLVALTAFVCVGAFSPSGAQAGVWDDLWNTPDQQAQSAFDAQAFDRAAALFTTPDRQGDALYRQGDFAQAAQAFDGSDYNRGNALAMAGAFQDALTSYDGWIAENPEDTEAIFNRDLVARLLEKQHDQSQQEDEQQQDQQGADENNDHPQSGEQQSSDGADQQGQTGEPQSQSDEGADQAGQQADTASQDQSGAAQQAQEQGTQPEPSTDTGQADGQPQQQEQVDQANETHDSESADSGFSQMMDRLLGDPQQAEDEPMDRTDATAAAQPTLTQSAEQQLRRVPDDPSGLLRARIRQHYTRLRAANQTGN